MSELGVEYGNESGLVNGGMMWNIVAWNDPASLLFIDANCRGTAVLN